MRRIPFYYECKAAFIIWLIVGKGHIFLYRHFVHPALRRHEDAIDAALLDAQLHAVQASSAWGKRGLKWVAEQVMQRWSDAPAVVAGAVLGASTSLSGVLRDASAKQDVKDEQQSAIPSREPRPPQDDRKTSTNRPQSFASRFHLTSQAAQPRARRRSSSTSKRPRSLSPAKSKTSSSPPPTLRPNAATTLPAGFHVDPSEWDDLLRTVSESNMAGDA